MATDNVKEIENHGVIDYLLHSTGTLLALSVFVPVFFLLVKNSHMFPIEYFTYATLTALAISLGFFAIGIIWDNGIKHLPFSTITLDIKSLFLIFAAVVWAVYVYYSTLSIFGLRHMNIIFCSVFFILGVLFYSGAQRITPCLKFCLVLAIIFIPLYCISNFYLLESDWSNDKNASALFYTSKASFLTLWYTSAFIFGVMFNKGIHCVPMVFKSIHLSYLVPVNKISSVVVGISSALLLFYYSLPTEKWFGEDTAIYSFCTFVVLIFVFIILKFTQKILVVFLAIFLAISVVHLPINLYSEYSTGNEMPFTSFAKSKIENKPNIYLFYLESYVDLESMDRIFAINTDDIKEKLNQYSYVTYNNTHSNAPYTLASLYTCFTAQPEYLKIHRGFADVIMPVRSMIGGSEHNILFSFFKDNGYKTISYYNSPSYYFYDRGPLLDESSFPEGGYSIEKKIGLTLNKVSPFMISILKVLYPNSKLDVRSRFPMEPKMIIEKVQEVAKSKQPTFFVFKKGAFHAPNGHHWSDGAEWVASNTYQKNIAKSNTEVFEIMDGIAEHDPNAIVILMGDHGPMRLLKIDQGCSNVDELDKKLVDNGFTMQELIQDRFGIFLAVKMPDYAQQDITFGHSLITPANLFRHIFAALDHNPAFLENRTEDAFYLDYSGLKLTMEDIKD